MISPSASLIRLCAMGIGSALGLIQVIVTMKLLGPSEVGTYTFATLLAQPFTDSVLTGMTWAIYRDPSAPYSRIRQLGTLFLCIGFANGLAFLTVHSILRDSLLSLSTTMALVVALSSLEGVLSGLASRHLQFLEMSLAGVLGMTLNVAVSWYAASSGVGATSLAMGLLAGLVGRIVCLQALNKEKFRLVHPGALSQIAYDIKFAGWTSLFKTTSNLGRNVPGWMISFLESEYMLGLFNRGQRIASVPGDVFVIGFGGMVGPSLARLASDKARMEWYFIRFLAFGILACSGLTLLGYAANLILVPMIATDRWEGLAAVTGVLLWMGLFRGLLRLADDFLRLSGTLSSQVWVTSLNVLLLATVLYAGHQAGFDLQGYATLSLLCIVVTSIIMGTLCAQAMGIGVLELVGKVINVSGQTGTWSLVATGIVACISLASPLSKFYLASICFITGLFACSASYMLYKNLLRESIAAKSALIQS